MAFSTVFSDDFSGAADVTDLWTYVDGTNEFQRNSSILTLSGGSTDTPYSIYPTALSDSEDQRAEVHVHNDSRAKTTILFIRWDKVSESGAIDAYRGYWQYTSGTYNLLKWVNGTFTILGSTGTSSYNDNSLMAVQAIGTSLLLELKGSTVTTATDSSVASGGFGLEHLFGQAGFYNMSYDYTAKVQPSVSAGRISRGRVVNIGGFGGTQRSSVVNSGGQ